MLRRNHAARRPAPTPSCGTFHARRRVRADLRRHRQPRADVPERHWRVRLPRAAVHARAAAARRAGRHLGGRVGDRAEGCRPHVQMRARKQPSFVYAYEQSRRTASRRARTHGRFNISIKVNIISLHSWHLITSADTAHTTQNTHLTSTAPTSLRARGWGPACTAAPSRRSGCRSTRGRRRGSCTASTHRPGPARSPPAGRCSSRS